MALFLPRKVQLAFQAFLAEPQLRQAVVEERQVRRIDVHGQRRHQVIDLLDLARDSIGVGRAAMLLAHLRDEPLNGGVHHVVVRQDNLLELAKHPGFQLLGPKRRGRRADRLAMRAPSGALVVVGDDRSASLDAAFVAGRAPELVAAVAADHHAGQQPAAIAMASSTDRPVTLGYKHLDLLPIVARNDRRHGVGNDDPVIFARLDHLGLAGLPATLFGATVLEPVELGLSAAVPDEIAAVRRIFEDRLDRREVPKVLARSRDATRVQVGGDGGEAHSVQAHAEDRLYRFDALRIRQHQPGLAFAARFQQRLALRVAGGELAVLVKQLAHAAGAEADAEHHRAVRGDDLAVVAEWRSPSRVGFRHHSAELAAQRILRQRNRELTILELFDRSQHVAVDALAAQKVLGDAHHHHACFAEQVAEVLCLANIAAAESVRVPDDHRLELATLRVGDHVLKGRALVRRGSRNRVIDEFADDLISVFASPAANLGPLVTDAFFLVARASAQVGHGGHRRWHEPRMGVRCRHVKMGRLGVRMHVASSRHLATPFPQRSP